MDGELSVLWRVRKTVNAMLLSRGYVLSSADLELDMDDFRARFGDPTAAGAALPNAREQLTILASHRTRPDDAMFVFWAEEDKIGVKPIKSYVLRMEKEHITRAILVLKKGITTFARRVLHELSHPSDPSAPRRTIELFEDVELLVDITQHAFVPKHVILSDEDKHALLSKYKLKETQLPRMQQVDPIARYFGLTKGQVVKIIRPSETAGRYVTYRLVV